VSATFICARCTKSFTTDQTHVRSWSIEKWWVMVGRQCANCRVETQGEPRQREIVVPVNPVQQPLTRTLAQARAELMTARTEGAHCPCCDQFAKIYRRRINKTMARSLIALYKAGGNREPVHSPSVLGQNRGEEARLSYWGLIVEAEGLRDDGGRRGWWQVTRRGELFLAGALTVPAYALVYNGVCLELAGDPVTFGDCLGVKFSLRDLMDDQG
jgi:hypothetical protein